MTLHRDALTLAVRNIARYGDTDVYPFPFENHVLFDDEDKVVDLLEKLHADFENWLSEYPPLYVKSLATVGYAGFRAPTQIDPVWNAYLLGLVLSVASEIEAARIPAERKSVFAYRYAPDPKDYALFNRDFGWRTYHKESCARAKNSKFVLVCDIADFYPRIYHHRLENALKKACSDSETVRRIMQILARLSDGVSYGLPVGGPAARLLSELLLNRTDRHLASEGIAHCRFVDDFHLFAQSKEEAYSQLVFLSETLMTNEGLSLQKTKTRIMTAEEFVAASPYSEAGESNSETEEAERAFLRIRLRYDPYSATAEEAYGKLRAEILQFDVVGMLGKELRKTQVDETLTRQLIKSLQYLDSGVRDDAIVSLIDNLGTLYPIFPAVALVLQQTLASAATATRERVYASLRGLIRNNSYILRVPANLAYAIRVLAHDASEETETIFSDLYKRPLDMMLKRDIILAMARRNADYWISNCRKQFSTLTPWERRALLVASFILEDEGAHWRRAIKRQLTEPEVLVMNWAATKKSVGGWEIPL